MGLISIPGVTFAPTAPTWSTVIYSGGTIPADSLLFYDYGLNDTLYAQGLHTTGAASATLVDSNKAAQWTASEWVDYVVQNRTAVQSGTITGNTTTVITATLSGSETWDVDDAYVLEHPTVLRDTTKAWTTNEWASFRLINTTDGSSGTISSNTPTEITVSSMTGGTNNAFRVGDDYEIVLAVDINDQIKFNTRSNLNGVLTVSVLGVPSITGTSGTHTFNVQILDASDSLNPSATFLVTATV